MNAIEVNGASKRFGDFLALDDISLTVNEGEVMGILGPNGAGKTTLVNAMAGLSGVDSGTIQVLGMDPSTSGPALRERIGLQLQTSQLPQNLRVAEAMRLYASFYANPADPDPLLEDWGLSTKKDTSFESLSGGQKQRLFICLALINNPELVILDELTTGLDPAARRASWDLIERIRDRGVTILLVTHFMEEAQRLCDRLALMKDGRIVRIDTPTNLTTSSSQLLCLSFTPPEGFSTSLFEGIEGISSVSLDRGEISIEGTGYLMAAVSGVLARHGINPPDIAMETLTLDDVFMELAGSAAPVIA